MNRDRHRLGVVLSHPTQYYSPWFRWVATNSDVDLRVFYLWDFGVRPTHDPLFQKTFSWDVDLLSGYSSEFIVNEADDPGTHHFSGLYNPALLKRLTNWKPDALLLFGYKSYSQMAAILWARLNSVPLIFRGDSHFLGRGMPPRLSKLLLNLLYQQFSAFAFVGLANREYFASLGVPASKLFFSPHAVDTRLFDPTRPEIRMQAASLRADLGIERDVRVILYAGKLVPAKQPRELLLAFIHLQVSNAALVFVGDGQERDALVALAENALPGSIHFLPFANQSEMPARYLAADIFVLPSRGHYETWGLAVNEAMHMGIPALVSDRVGCQQDLVTDGDTGWVFKADDVHDLREKLSQALAADLAPFKRSVRLRISRYTYRHAADGLLRAYTKATGHFRPSHAA